MDDTYATVGIQSQLMSYCISDIKVQFVLSAQIINVVVDSGSYSLVVDTQEECASFCI